MPDLEKVLKLKAEGNALFTKKKFLQAFDKYTAAIQEDEENAVLYANRAACSASMGKQMAAVSDAKKSVELDPKYVKGWVRLATAQHALASWDDCVESWKNAIEALPPLYPQSPTTEADEKTREQYEVNLDTALERQKLAHKFPPVIIPAAVSEAGKLPWDRAKELEPELIAMGKEGLNSSAWPAMRAYSELMEGNQTMNALKKIGPNGMMFGRTGGIECISNSVTSDHRMFHLSDNKWINKYNDQVILEATKTNAWVKEGLDVVMRDAQKRLSQGMSWNKVRPALAVTIRGWVVMGFLENMARHDYDEALKHFGWALQAIRQGRQIWRDVSPSDRGVVFEDTFLRGVQALHLDVVMQQCSSKGDPIDRLEALAELADDLYKSTMAAAPWPQKDELTMDGTGFHIAFNVYPAANALAKKGYFHQRMADKQKLTEAKKTEHIEKAAASYREASALYPPDDEHSQFFLCYAIDYMLRLNKPLRETLPLLATLRKNNPRMLRIWEASSLAPSRDKIVNAMLTYEKKALDAIKRKEITEDDPFPPMVNNKIISLVHNVQAGAIYI